MSTQEMKKSLGLRARLFIGFGMMMLLFLISIGVTLSILMPAKKFADSVIEVELPTYDAFLDLTTSLYKTQILVNELINSQANVKNEYDLTWQKISELEIKLDSLSKDWINDQDIYEWKEIKNLLSQLKSSNDSALSLTNKSDAVEYVKTNVIPILKKITMQLNSASSNSKGILDVRSSRLNQGMGMILKNLFQLEVVQGILIVIGIIFTILVSSYTTRQILKPVSTFRKYSERIASGDLRENVIVKTNDEMGMLGNDLNKMTESLSAIAKELTEASHNMVSTLEEVQHAVDSQSAGAAEQAASINEITASVSEIEKSSAQTMEKAKNLGQVAELTREKAQLGLNAVEQSVKGMCDVREKVQLIAQTILDLSNKSQQVGDITSVVNNLAQQSKMLALNASIEAAKAGEAGKGFAVVAVEVKNLAVQSEQSTEQVQKILEDIRHATEKAVMVTEEGTKGVDLGASLIEQTGEIIRNLNEVIHETTLATQQIEAAVRQEGAGIEQITAGMNEINQVTASFVSSVKQTTVAIANLAEIAKRLKTHVDVYKL